MRVGVVVDGYMKERQQCPVLTCIVLQLQTGYTDKEGTLITCNTQIQMRWLLNGIQW